MGEVLEVAGDGNLGDLRLQAKSQPRGMRGSAPLRPGAGCGAAMRPAARRVKSDRRWDDAAATLFAVSDGFVDHVEYRQLRVVAEVVASG